MLILKIQICLFQYHVSHRSLEYGGASFNSLFAQRKNIFSIKFISLILEINKFYKIGREFNLNFKLKSNYRRIFNKK